MESKNDRDKSPKRVASWNCVFIDPNESKFKRIDVEKDLNTLVGGKVQLMPSHEDLNTQSLICYVDEEGVLKQLSQNFLAGLVLNNLGFMTETCIPKHIVSGPAVLMREDHRKFSKANREAIVKATYVATHDCQAYDCFEELTMASKECEEKGCKSLICDDCRAMGRQFCEIHRPSGG